MVPSTFLPEVNLTNTDNMNRRVVALTELTQYNYKLLQRWTAIC